MTSGSAPGPGTPGDAATLFTVLRREQRLLRSLVVQLQSLHHDLFDEHLVVTPVELADAVEAAEYTAERLGVDELARAVLTSGLGLGFGVGAEPPVDALLRHTDGEVHARLEAEAAALRVLCAQLVELAEAVRGAVRRVGGDFPDAARLVPPSLVQFLRRSG